MTYSILIIGDDASLRSELVSTLREAGFAVDSMPDYPETLFNKNGFKADLVIIDETLASGDSMETCYQLRNTFGIPVVLLGTDSSDEAWRRVMEADADLYLLKPIRYRELTARVKSILRRFPQVAHSRSKKREIDDMKGLTAIEILIAVAIIILLAVVVVPRLMELIGG